MLRLLDDVSWRGAPVPSGRTHALLAALVAAGGRPVGEAALVEQVWEDDVPANPAKALQVVVSRARSQTAPEVVARSDHGYRLGLPAAEVDALVIRSELAAAVTAESSGDLASARDHARAVLAVRVASGGRGPLAELREGAHQARVRATAVLGRSLSTLGDHREALPLLEEATERAVGTDEPSAVALLRSLASVRGAPEALDRYEVLRAELADRLGVDPGPDLRAVHAELLAADHPVRSGLRFEASSLVGRDDDLRALRGLVRQSRVVSIVGPGGLGKTRLAHLLGQQAEQQVVHFVELVGVVSPDDVVGEVGSALGVRDSLSGRRTLTPEQRADVRGRIAQQVDQAPTLLILDNCEHVVAAVADLVAFLVATASRLRVVTTTRSPLAIAAERVFALGQLDQAAATELFRSRALAARPGAVLADDAVTSIVRRLDGLPLAIELAAAKVRAMSLADIDRRLDDRFALLRGGDRSAPDRHQTLLAVIDWSWNLLGDRERVALSRLALFHDGFGLDAAESVLGADALAVVESLTSQSLLTVREDDDVRYRMLETVRELGVRRLGADQAPARSALRDWAVDLCGTRMGELYGPAQLDAVRALTTEENNLADELRQSLTELDPAGVVVILAALGGAWTIRGEHPRIIAMTGAVESALDGWEPPEELVDATAAAALVMVLNTAVVELVQPHVSRRLLTRYGPLSSDPQTRAFVRVLSTFGDDGPGGTPSPMLQELCDDPDRLTAMVAMQWVGYARENAGDTEGAMELGERALARWHPDDGVWSRARLQTQLAELHAQLGRPERASGFALDALGVLDALEAHDDAAQLRSMLACAAMVEGRVDDATRLVEQMVRHPLSTVWGGVIVVDVTRAELVIAQGDLDGGLALYDRALTGVRALRLPGLDLPAGWEPWTLYAESAALNAYARFGAASAGAGLHDLLVAKLGDLLGGSAESRDLRIDYPVLGCVFYALGTWQLTHGQATDPDTDRGVELFAIAERFGYNRFSPSMQWRWATERCEQMAPGALAERLASYDGRRGVDVLAEARALAGHV